MGAPKAFLALVLALKVAAALAFGNRGIATEPRPQHAIRIADLHFRTKVDHFNTSDDRTWRQAYFVNDTYWNGPASDAPVFVFIGGEVPIIDMSLLASNFVSDWLPATGAILFTLEHRYYGCYDPAACPFDVTDPPPNHLQYLSSRQSAADYAEFHRFATEHYGLVPNTKWVVFGGSYPGILAAMLRAEYPALFHSAVASSAPVHVKLDFVEFENEVSEAYALDVEGVHGSPECRDAIAAGHRQVRRLLASRAGRAHLAELFNLSTAGDAGPLETEKERRTFAGCGVAHFPAQGNDPRCTDPLCGISQICDFMAADVNEGLSALERLAVLRATQVLHQGPDWALTMEVCEMDSLWEMSGYVPFPMRYWGYQTCTEFGFYQTCNEGSRCMFTQGLISFQDSGTKPSDFCYEQYGIPFDETMQRINETRAYLDERIAGATRILWANGNVDPWSTLSHRRSPGRDQPVIWPIEGASHMAWLKPADPYDQQSIKDARERIYAQICAWLGNDGDLIEHVPGVRAVVTEFASHTLSKEHFMPQFCAFLLFGVSFVTVVACTTRRRAAFTPGTRSLQEPLAA